MDAGHLHFPRLPDWVIYSAVTLALLIGAFGRQGRIDAPAPPPPVEGEEALPLSPTSPFAAEEVISAPGRHRVEVGTAFSVGEAGAWITARHVVRDCRRVALLVAKGKGVVATVRTDARSDLAVLTTEGGAPALPLLTKASLSPGERGFHPGFPKGGPGEATSRFLGEETLAPRRRGEPRQRVLAWAESGRTDGIRGSLAGLSGAPVLDEAGRVAGVTLAEQPRRGRIYTTSTAALARTLRAARVEAAGVGLSDPITVENYGRAADSLRRDLRVAQVICLGR